MRVDAHAHLVPESLLALARDRGHRRGLAVEHTSSGEWRATLSDGSRRDVHPALFDLDRRWRRMDEQGVDLQVVSGWNEFYGYHLSSSAGRWWARAQNEHLAATAADHPSRLAPVATVPLQDVRGAIDEVRHAASALRMCGIVIGTNVRGQNLDDPSLDPFWSTVAELELPVVVHPSIAGGIGPDRLTRHMLSNVIGNPTETTIAAASLINANVLQRHRLKVLFVHGGGFLPYQIGRVRRAIGLSRAAKGEPEPDAAQLLSGMYFDTLLHDAYALALLVRTTGETNVVFGTDYPFEMGEARSAATVLSDAGLSRAAMSAVMSTNPATLFALSRAG